MLGRIAAGFVGLALCGVIALLLLRERLAPGGRAVVSVSQSSSVPDSEGILERRIELLERKAGALDFLQRMPGVRVVEHTDVDASAEAFVPRERSVAPTVAHMDDLVKKEPRDRKWADEYELATEEALAKNFSDDKITDIECATSLCRLSVAHQSELAQAEFGTKFWASLPPGYAAWHTELGHDADGKPTTIVHVIREGYMEAVGEENAN